MRNGRGCDHSGPRFCFPELQSPLRQLSGQVHAPGPGSEYVQSGRHETQELLNWRTVELAELVVPEEEFMGS